MKRTLGRRIVQVFVSLLLLVMGLIVVLVTSSNQRIITNETARELELGAHVFERLIQQNQHQLETSATVLAGDFAFREAIATQDRDTMQSVLRNHGLRIGAQIMLVLSPEGELLTDTVEAPGAIELSRLTELLNNAQSASKSTLFRRMKDGRLYQLVVVPILAPKLIAWVAMGFKVDDAWVKDVSELVGLQTSILQRTPTADALLASSLEPAQRSALLASLAMGHTDAHDVLILSGTSYQTTQMPLGVDVYVVLQRAREQVEAPFIALQRDLLLIMLAGIALFALGSIMVARRIVKPINDLSLAAQRMEAGDYAQNMPAFTDDEIGALATSFDNMRGQVASREEKILRLAYEDSLTGLPNRTRFVETVNRLSQRGSGAVIVLNINRFALINHALGHPVGDRLLQEIGIRLRQLQQPPQTTAHTVAHLWGNEFAFLYADHSNAAITQFAQSIQNLLHLPMVLDGQRLDISACMGIAVYPDDGKEANVLLRRAELSMRAAKQRHTSFVFATDAGSEPKHEQLSMVGEMRDGLAQGEFILHYQPKISVVNNAVVGVEALVRWQHPVRGMVPPGEFIPFAEQTGFIREITPWVLQTALQQCAQWHQQGLIWTTSVNLSALDLLNPSLPLEVDALLQQHQLPASSLCLEITESALLEDPDLALRHLFALQALGVKLSIDDYGAGQASLSYIKDLPVHELKIDRAFVTDIAQTPKNAAIVHSTIVLSHALGLTFTAEGAETEHDLSWLAENGCDVAQGYGIARPMSVQALAQWVSARESKSPASISA